MEIGRVIMRAGSYVMRGLEVALSTPQWGEGGRRPGEGRSCRGYGQQRDPSSACGTFSPLRRGEGYKKTTKLNLGHLRGLRRLHRRLIRALVCACRGHERAEQRV